jgi:hypothetical protein
VLLAERLVRPVPIEFPSHPIETLLLGSGGDRRRRRRLFLQRQMTALVPAVLLRMARIDPIELIPSFNHHTARCESCAAPVVANGVARSRSAARAAAHIPKDPLEPRPHACLLGAIIRQHSTNRLCTSATVNGSHRVPSAVRNHPLKSTVHTSLGACAAANGRVSGTVYRRRLRGWLRPARRSASPIRARGRPRPQGLTLEEYRTQFLRPSIAGADAVPRQSPAPSRRRSPTVRVRRRDRFAKPCSRSASERATHLYAVLRLTPYRSASSVIVHSSRSQSAIIATR